MIVFDHVVFGWLSYIAWGKTALSYYPYFIRRVPPIENIQKKSFIVYNTIVFWRHKQNKLILTIDSTSWGHCPPIRSSTRSASLTSTRRNKNETEMKRPIRRTCCMQQCNIFQTRVKIIPRNMLLIGHFIWGSFLLMRFEDRRNFELNFLLLALKKKKKLENQTIYFSFQHI